MTFATDLTAWQAKHGLSDYAVAKLIGASHGSVIAKWRDGGPVRYEPAIRAFMREYDRSQKGP